MHFDIMPTVKQLNTKIDGWKADNADSRTELAELKTKLKHLSSIHSYLFDLRQTHQPPTEPKQQQKDE